MLLTVANNAAEGNFRFAFTVESVADQSCESQTSEQRPERAMSRGILIF
jgi:hypothetical protein